MFHLRVSSLLSNFNFDSRPSLSRLRCIRPPLREIGGISQRLKKLGRDGAGCINIFFNETFDHLQARSEVERQTWVTSLALAKNHSITKQENEEDVALEVSVQDAQTEQQKLLKTLADKLDDVKTCNDLVGRHSQALKRRVFMSSYFGPVDKSDQL